MMYQKSRLRNVTRQLLTAVASTAIVALLFLSASSSPPSATAFSTISQINTAGAAGAAAAASKSTATPPTTTTIKTSGRITTTTLNSLILATKDEEVIPPPITTNTNNNINIKEEDVVSPIFPVGSRVIRLPERGTRVRLFYPTTDEAAAAAAITTEGGKSDEDGISYEYAPYNTDNRSSSPIDVLRRQSSLSGCILNAPLLADIINSTGDDDDTVTATTQEQQQKQLPPILIYSHDIGMNMDTSAFLFQTIASKGKTIVAAIEHTDGTAGPYTLRPDNKSKLNFLKHFMTERQQLARRASELLEAVDYIPKFLLRRKGGQLDDNSEIDDDEDADQDNDAASSSSSSGSSIVMLGGHGWGAPSAVMAANGVANSTTTTLAGIILHDPILGMGYGMLPPNKSNNRLPTITYTSDEYHNKKRVIYGERTLHVKGCSHTNFVDALRWRKEKFFRVVPPGVVDPVQVHEQLADSMTRFLQTGGDWNEDVVVANNNLFDVIR